jgi:hypothetical protein
LTVTLATIDFDDEDEPATEEELAELRPTSVTMIRQGNTYVPLYYNSRCKVCRSDCRFEVERGLMTAVTYPAILNSLPDGTGLNVDNIKKHYRNGHLGLQRTVTRRIVEQRAAEIGKSADSEADLIADQITLARMVVQRATEKLGAGEVDVTIADGLAAAKLLEAANYSEDEANNAIYSEVFLVFYDTLRKTSTPDVWSRFDKAIRTNPMVTALLKRARGERPTQDDEPLEGEVAEEVLELARQDTSISPKD